MLWCLSSLFWVTAYLHRKGLICIFQSSVWHMFDRTHFYSNQSCCYTGYTAPVLLMLCAHKHKMKHLWAVQWLCFGLWALPKCRWPTTQCCAWMHQVQTHGSAQLIWTSSYTFCVDTVLSIISINSYHNCGHVKDVLHFKKPLLLLHGWICENLLTLTVLVWHNVGRTIHYAGFLQ